MFDQSPIPTSLLTQGLLEAKVSTLNPAEPLTVQSTDSVASAINLLREHSSGSVLVLESDELKGIFTEQDVVRRVAIANIDPEKTPISQVMTSNLETLRKRASVARAIYIMAKGGFRHLPIVTPGERPSATLSVRDTVRHIFDLMVKELAITSSGKFLNAEALTIFLESSANSLPIHLAVSLPETSTSKLAVQAMLENKVGSIAVVKQNGSLCGIFTERDYITKLSGNPNWKNTPLPSAMTNDPKIVRSGSTIRHCVQLMSDGGYRHLPIVDREDRPTHILSVRDFVNAFGDSIVEDLEHRKSVGD